MIDWEVRFDVRRALPGFARPRRAAQETVARSYRIEGRRRRDDGAHALQVGLAGRGRFRDAEGERTIGPGDAFLFRVDDPAVAYRHAGGDEPWRFVFCAFYGAEVEVAALLRRHGAVRPLGLAHPAIERLGVLRRHAGRSLTPGAAALLVHDLLAALADPVGPRGAGARLVDRARDVMAASSPPTTVGDLAAALAVSREHLARAFRRELGCPPGAWQTEQQVHRACAALRGSEASLDTVAAASGLGSASHLCKVFRRVIGCTPGQYRRGQAGPLP